MRRTGWLLASWMVVLLALVPWAASAAPKSLVLLFTGDNGGEIAPCG